MLGEAATKAALASLYHRTETSRPPALLFSGTHGIEFEPDDK
jgi:hypothetical protein